MANPLLALPLLEKAIDAISDRFPTPQEKTEAKLQLRNQVIDGHVKLTDTMMAPILAEANSEDKWTSRARPTFLYVVYVYILLGVPMAILGVLIDPEIPKQIAAGIRAWLEAIPEAMWWVFGVGFTGYTTARSADKFFELKNKEKDAQQSSMMRAMKRVAGGGKAISNEQEINY